MIYRLKNELMNDYYVTASFYNYKLSSEESVLCRNVADVIKKEFHNHPIDAYIIMINPGSCKSSIGEINLISSFENVPITFTDSIDDPAQRCVMQLMDNTRLKHVRIFNLSDVVNSKYVEAVSTINALSDEFCIFNPIRRNELNALTTSEAPYFVCWGKDNSLLRKKEMAMDFLKSKQFIGIMDNSNPYNYAYIKPPVMTKQHEIIEHLTNIYISTIS